VIQQANITAWRAHAPWPDDAQVEQDVVLTRALIQVFSEPNLAVRFDEREVETEHGEASEALADERASNR